MSDDEIMKIFNLVAERINFMKTVLQRKYVPSAMSKEDFIKYYDPMLLILFFTLFNLNIKKFLLEKKMLILYFFNGLFLFLNFLR